ncbi:MAG: transcriptional regulator [Hyphococcus sp.]|nr:MAG: transcriptional regulator [Marinicaulis sp.]
MARPSSKTLTEAEQRVMQALWARGEASVRDVVDDLEKDHGVAYNTVLTILGILHKKKYVSFRREGRAHIYQPAVSQTDARHEAFDHLVSRFFGGSKNAFAQYLLEEEAIDPTELEQLKKLTNSPRTKGKSK